MKKFSVSELVPAGTGLRTVIRAAAISTALAFAGLPAAFAGSFAEAGDAGDLVNDVAQLVTGNPGVAITSITGTLSLSAGISEVDAFKIYIDSPASFSATTTGFTPGANSFDTQLFLFTLGGVGVVGNDDDAAGGPQSTLPAGSSFTSAMAPGYYYLVIAGSGQNPSSAGGVIFPSWTDGSTDPTGVYGPIGAGGGSAISSFDGASNEGGAYSIKLTGVSIAPVPEPSTLALALAGGLVLIARRRRRD